MEGGRGRGSRVTTLFAPRYPSKLQDVKERQQRIIICLYSLDSKLERDFLSLFVPYDVLKHSLSIMNINHPASSRRILHCNNYPEPLTRRPPTLLQSRSLRSVSAPTSSYRTHTSNKEHLDNVYSVNHTILKLKGVLDTLDSIYP